MINILRPILQTHVKRQVMSVRCTEYSSFDLTTKVNVINNARSSSISKELILSKENRENCISKFKSMKQVGLYGKEPTKSAAVLVPLCLVNNELSLLYTLRSSGLKSYRGQVSFPGGVQDETDENLEETALRETCEELGTQRTRIDVWGNGSFVGTRQRDLSVMPFIGYLGEVSLEELILNRKEVESVFTMPLKHLIEPDNCKSTQFRSGYVLPVFIGGEHRIWGITAIITHFVLNALLPTGTYVHKIHYIKSFNTSSPGTKKSKL